MKNCIFLILFLGLCGCLRPEVKSGLRAPQSISSIQFGTYDLVTGFDGCPEKLKLQPNCDGFTMSSLENDQVVEAYHFCAPNKGARNEKLPTSKGTKIRQTTLKQMENSFARIQLLVMKNKTETITLRTEDTLIYDETGKLLWEHRDELGQGSSCLYQSPLTTSY